MGKLLAILAVMLFLFPAVPVSMKTEAIPTFYSAPLGGTDYPWPMFRHDSSASGATLASAPSTGTTMWTYDTGATIYSSPAVVDGVIYIANYNAATSRGSLYAIDEYSGALKWVFPTYGPISASPAVANGIVYAGSRDTYMYALNAQTGSLVWARSRASFPITSSPVVADGTVYYSNWCAAPTCGLYSEILAVDAATGNVKWLIQSASGFISSSASVHNGRVFFGQEDGYVVALNQTTGSVLWRQPTTGNAGVITAAAVAYGKVFVGTESRFEARDELTGGIIWTFNTQGNNVTSAAVNNGIVYFGTGRGFVRALNATTGVGVWSYDVGSVVASSPALALGSNTLVVGANDNYVYALNISNGALLWRYRAGGVVSSSPAVADGRIFVGSWDHKVYGLGPIAPALQASITASQNVLKPGETSVLTITVTNGTSPMSGATLTLSSSSGGGFTAPVELSPGTYQSNYTSPLVNQQAVATITAVAGVSGYLDDSASTVITLLPFPALSVAVTPSPSSVTPGGETVLLIRVTNGSEPITGALINLFSSGGGTFSGMTDNGNGNYTAVYSTSLQASSPTVTVQASKTGFSTGQAIVTITVSGIPDLTTVKIYGFPLFLLVLGGFLLLTVVIVGLVAKRKIEQNPTVPNLPAYAFASRLGGRAYLDAGQVGS